MADTELKQISSGPADVIVEVEEEAPLSNDKDDEENAGSDGDSSSKNNDNQAPQDSHRRNYTVDEITKAIVTGNLEAIRDWLSSLPQGDERKDELNTVKYKDDWKDDCTVLHIAAESNQVAIAKELLQEGADPNITDGKGLNALHTACIASHDVNNTEMVEQLIERVCNIDETTDSQRTPLHYAARGNHTTAVKMLLQKGADPNKKDEDGRNALHWVCYASSDANITEVVELLIESKCRVNEQDDYGRNPLFYAALWNNLEAVRLLLKNGADVELQDKGGDQPIFKAAEEGNNEMIDVLVKKHVKADPKVLEKALRNGHKYLVKQLIKTPKWATLMRHTFKISDKITTPFREMVKKMPDVAEEILNKCTINNPDYTSPDHEYYSVAFCYEFLEDAKDKEQRTSLLMRNCLKNEADEHGEDNQPIHGNNDEERNEDGQRDVNYYNIVFYTREQKYQTIWGPEGFKKETHPLAMMVKYKRLNLLTHPVVASLLHYKWNKFGLLWYIINLLTYLVFLISLTTFALIIENPRSQACLSVFLNMSSNYSENYCGISTSRISFIYISALLVIILSLCRLVLEVLQFKIQLLRYLYDWNNWMETALYIFSIIFVFVFRNDCLCPLTWQWQIGVVAVFLGWMNLVVFISKFPVLGIYVLMFINIFKTFIKTLLLSILLIVSFGLTFYLTFTQPEILRSPFSTPARSLLKIVTMTTGELDFDSIFRQDPAGGSDDAEEIPFPPISYMLWIVFIIIMPILLNNMLVGLAIGDIEAIQKDAKLKKLALQVDQVLTVEEFMPRKWRRHFTCGYTRVWPNLKHSLIERCQFFLWGGKRYDTRESIGKVLHPKETSVTEQVVDSKTAVNKESEKVLHEVADLKMSLNDEMEKTQERNDKVLQEVGDLKICLHDEIEKAQEKNDEVIQVLQRSFHGELETAQRMNEKLVHEVGDLKISLHEEIQKAQTSVNDEMEKTHDKVVHEIEKAHEINDKVLHEVEDLKISLHDEKMKTQEINDKVLHEVEDLKNSVDEMKQLLRQIALKQGGTEVQ